MKQGSIAKRYASALLQVASEQGNIDDCGRELSRLVQVLAENPPLQTALASPVVPPSKKKAVFGAVAAKLGFGASVSNLMHILIDNERVGELSLLSMIYHDLADDRAGRVRVDVTSAAPLGENEAKLKALLKKTLKREVILETKVDPEILGGLVVRVQDRVFNASLKGELERWKESWGLEAVA